MPATQPTEQAVSIVARCLGCSPEIARHVVIRIDAHPIRRGRFARDAHSREPLAWATFGAYRREVMGAGGDDPMWDLHAPAPVEMEGGHH